MERLLDLALLFTRIFVFSPPDIGIVMYLERNIQIALWPVFVKYIECMWDGRPC